jgi:hypothetical protein
MWLWALLELARRPTADAAKLECDGQVATVTWPDGVVTRSNLRFGSTSAATLSNSKKNIERDI